MLNDIRSPIRLIHINEPFHQNRSLWPVLRYETQILYIFNREFDVRSPLKNERLADSGREQFWWASFAQMRNGVQVPTQWTSLSSILGSFSLIFRYLRQIDETVEILVTCVLRFLDFFSFFYVTSFLMNRWPLIRDCRI